MPAYIDRSLPFITITDQRSHDESHRFPCFVENSNPAHFRIRHSDSFIDDHTQSCPTSSPTSQPRHWSFSPRSWRNCQSSQANRQQLYRQNHQRFAPDRSQEPQSLPIGQSSGHYRHHFSFCSPWTIHLPLTITDFPFQLKPALFCQVFLLGFFFPMSTMK